MVKPIDITGKRFGRLIAIRLDRIEKRKGGGTTHFWLCQWDCGNITIVRKVMLLNGHTKSCGCYQRDRAKIANIAHGLRYHPLYQIWLGIKKRCYNPNCQYYYCYGGRGITMCKEWKNNFKIFYDWAIKNGYKKNLSIDRINNNGDYEPSNCRWATDIEQARNSRHNRNITYNNEIHCVAEWAEILNISECKIRHRLNRGWNIEKTLFKK